MTLRNVPNSFTLEQQRQEVNLIAVDLDSAVDGIQTFSGSKTFSDDVTFSSTGDFNGTATFSSIADFNGTTTFSSTADFNGTATFNSSPTFADSVVANFGDDADLKIYYDGSVGVLTSFIDSDALQVRSATDTSELYATFLKDGPVELYHDGTKKFGTSATGASVLGDLDVSTDITCNSISNNAGGGATFQLTNTGSLTLDSGISCNQIFQTDVNFSLFADGLALFQDVIPQAVHIPHGSKVNFGSSSVPNIWASTYIQNGAVNAALRLDTEVGFNVRWYDSVNSQFEDQLLCSYGGSTNFYYQGAVTPTLAITDELEVDGTVIIGDTANTGFTGDVRIALGGNSSNPFNYLKIFGSSGEAYIRNNDNDIGNTALGINIQGRTGVSLWQDTGNLGLQVDSNCAVKLYYQTSEKLTTTTNGVEVTGTLDVSGNTTIGAPDVTNASTGGIQAFASGQLRIQRDGAGAATDKRFDIYYGTSETASITAGGDATFAGNLTLTDSTKEVTAQKIRPVDTATSLTIGGAGLGNIVMESDIVIFDQIGFIGFASAGMNLGAFGTGALNTTNGTGVNGIFRRYEEGTWSPDFLGLSAAFTSYSNKKGTYTRIGDVVHVHGFIQLTAQPSFTTSTDHLKIGPLPFNYDSSKNGGYNVTVGGVSCQNFNFHDNDYSNTGQVACGINTDATSGDSYVIFQVSGNNNTRGIVKNSAIGTNDIIEFQLSYQA